MKKMIAILMALMMLVLALPAYAEGDDIAEIADIAGTVIELGDGTLLIETPDGQPIEVTLTEETLYEGKTNLMKGDYIHVTYNGQMTRSYPAGIVALKVGCYILTGEVSDITEEGFTLITDTEIVIVNAPSDLLALVEAGEAVNVYFNGAMTMSLPAQIGAESITAVQKMAMLSGTVVEAYITIENADGEFIQVNLSSLTELLNGLPELGDTIEVGYNGQMTFSIPAQVTAQTIEVIKAIELTGEIVEINEDGILVQTAEMQVLVKVDAETAYEMAEAHELAVGDSITVVYDGVMTMSLPAQIYAQKIVVK